MWSSGLSWRQTQAFLLPVITFIKSFPAQGPGHNPPFPTALPARFTPGLEIEFFLQFSPSSV